MRYILFCLLLILATQARSMDLKSFEEYDETSQDIYLLGLMNGLLFLQLAGKEFNNSDEWYENLPEDGRPSKEQPFYHLLAENENTFYVAYVSEQNLLDDTSEELPKHPETKNLFSHFEDGKFVPLTRAVN